MPRPNDLGRLSPAEWDRLEEMADRFEAAWQSTDQVDLAAFLPAPADPLRRTALEELIKSDLEIRASHGQAVDLKAYLARFPELGEVRSLSPRLIYEEYRVRHRHGDRPSLESYRARFPDQFPELERIVNSDPVTPLPQRSTHHSSSDKMTESVPMIINTGNVLAVGGGYKMVKRIGRGSFGEVWQAEAPGGIGVAIKVILRRIDDEEGRREAKALEVIKRLSHPFLLPTHSFWAFEDRLVIVMELADGSLRDELNRFRLAGQPAIPTAELLRYFGEAADALDYLHSEKVLHRDIKPDNILVRNHRVRVADFGLVREQNQYLLTASSSGTPAYMAPEVWRGKTELHSDQYSLACTYAELRLGRRPFTDADYAGLMLSHLQGSPDLGPLPEAEQRALLRALAKEPSERYPTCSAFIQELREALGDLAGKSTHQLPVSSPTGLPSGARQPPSYPATGPTLPPRTAAGHATVRDPIPPAVSPPSRPAKPPSVTTEPMPVPTPLSASTPVDPLGTSSGLPVSSAIASEGGFAGRTNHGSAVQSRDWRGHGQPVLGKGPSRGPLLIVAVVSLLVAVGGAVAAYLVFARSRPGASTENTAATETTGSTTAAGSSAATNPSPHVPLPPGYVPLTDAKEIRDRSGRTYYDRIRPAEGSRPVVFVLIPQDSPEDPPTFYLAENKVWNGLYRSLQGGGESWQRGGQKDGADAGDADDLPVLRLTRDDAARAAVRLGGRLPSAAELDRAAGLARHPANRSGPFQGPRVAVNRRKEGPRPVNEATDDVSPAGVRDLAGNGQEWTSDTRQTEDGKEVAILRGRSYLAPGPLLYSDLEYQQKEPLTQYPDHASPYTGFRVALNVPN